MHVLGEHNGTKAKLYRTNTKSQGLVPAYFALIIIIVVHVVKHQSVLINTLIIIIVVHVVKHQSVLMNTCRINEWIPLVSVFWGSGVVSGIRGKQMTP